VRETVDSPNELVEAFAAAVPFALREMAGVDAVTVESRPAGADDGFGGVSAVIRLTTAGGGWDLTMHFPETTAATLARRILGGAVEEFGAELVRDCMGEVANVVAGQAKALLVGSPSHFTLGTPTVGTGPACAAGGWEIRFGSDAGEFAAQLSPHG
jgi:chemotaxis protein CheX